MFSLFCLATRKTCANQFQTELKQNIDKIEDKKKILTVWTFFHSHGKQIKAKLREEEPVKVVLKLETKAICLCAILILEDVSCRYIYIWAQSRWSIKRTCWLIFIFGHYTEIDTGLENSVFPFPLRFLLMKIQRRFPLVKSDRGGGRAC